MKNVLFAEGRWRWTAVFAVLPSLLIFTGCSKPAENASPSPAAAEVTSPSGNGNTGANPASPPTGTPVGRPGMAGVPKN